MLSSTSRESSNNSTMQQSNNPAFTFYTSFGLVRVDYFLKISRIVKRRPLAKEMCDKKLIAVNGVGAKAGKEVAVGDILTVQFPSRIIKVRIDQVPERAISKKDSSTLYTVLEEVQRPEEEW